MASDWPVTCLREIIDLKKGVSYQGKYLDRAGPKLLGLGTVVPGGGAKIEAARTYAGPIKDSQRIKPGEMYVALTDLTQDGRVLGSPALVPAYEDGEFAVTHHVARVIPLAPSVIDTRFLYYMLRSSVARSHMRAMATGTTVRAVHPRDALALEVRLPSVDEQCVIADVLGTLDDKIEMNRRMSETLDVTAQAVFRAMFLGSGQVPSLKMGRLSDVLTLRYGKALPKSRHVPGDVPVYGSGGVYGYHDVPLVEHPTVIVGRKGTVGSLNWVTEPCHPADTVFYVDPGAPLTFCYYLLQTLGLETMNTDAAVPGLNRENAYRLEVPVPAPDVLADFDAVARPMRVRLDICSEESKTLASLRDTLLPKLISGELRIPDAERLVSEVI